MRKVIISTVGFDEKLVIRSMLKLGIKEDYDIILVYSLSGGEYEQKKVRSAIESIRNVLVPLGVSVFEVNVPVKDIVLDVGCIIEALRKRGAESIVALLVGGMRILIIEVLIALILYKYFINPKVKIIFYTMREDGLYGASLPLELIHPPKLTDRELSVLKIICSIGEAVSRPKLVDRLSSELETSESLIYKVINSLMEKGVIEVRDSSIKLTLLGAMLCKVV